jgi:hypothetical protein
LAHLDKIGSFDEVSAGQGVLNLAAAHFISRDHRGMAATPQLIVVERTVRAEAGGVDPTSVREQVLVRKVGVAEISNWLAANAPLPSRRAAIDTAVVAAR